MAFEPHQEHGRKNEIGNFHLSLGIANWEEVGLKPVDTTHCVWTIRQLDATDDTPPLGMVIAYVDDLIAVGDQSQLDCMKAELD